MNLQTLFLATLGLTLSPLALVGCDQKGAGGEPTLETAALALSTSAATDLGAETVRYTIDRVACTPGESFEAYSKVTDVAVINASLADFNASDANPLDGGSAHIFADSYNVLAAGCYDVSATALDANGQALSACATALLSQVQVFDGQTTEITLLLQCEANETGGLDAIAAFNIPPVITALTYSPSKFATDCEEVTICASAMDPDGDPLTFQWAAALTPTTTEIVDETTTQCATFPAGQAGSHDLQVTVFDNLVDAQGQQVTIESWLANTGSAAQSRDSLDFPLYVAADDCSTSGPPSTFACPVDGGMVDDPSVFAAEPAETFDGLDLTAPFQLDGIAFTGWWFTSDNWCIPGMDSNAPSCGGTNNYLAGDGNRAFYPTTAGLAVGFNYGTQGNTFTVRVHLLDGTSEEFVVDTPAPGGWGAAGYFGYCATADAPIDYIEIDSGDGGIDNLVWVD